jgi:ribosomal protein S18 acetylase RimI-like enzyme
MRRIFALILVLLGASSVHAQSVRWEPADSGDPSELQLVFEECAPNGDPRLPAVDGLTLTLTGNSRQTNIINGSISRLVVLTYRARSRQTGPIQIPAFTIQTDKGPLKVAAYSGGSAGVASDLGTSSTLAAPTATFWAGEVFPLTYTLSVPRRYFNQLGSDLEWSASPLVVEEWSKPEPGKASANGDIADILYKTRAYAKTPGRVTLNAVQQLVNLQTGSSSFGFFQQPRIEQISVTSNRPDFTIRPLPVGAPATFNGAVGQFTLVSKVVPATAAVGEPVTWTLTLAEQAGRIVGFLATIPVRGVLDQLFIAPHAQRAGIGGRLMDVAATQMPAGFSLRTAADNHAARRFYEARGMVLDRMETHPVHGHLTAIYRAA